MFDVLAPLRDLRAAMALPFAVAALALITAPAQAALTEATPLSPIGSAGSGALEFNAPAGVAVNRTSGDVYVADSGNNRIQRLTSDGAFISTFGWGVRDGSNALQVCVTGCEAGIAGDGDGQLSGPAGIAIDPSSGDVFVADQGNTRIVHYDASGAYVGAFGNTGDSPLGSAAAIAFGPGGDLYVGDFSRIAVFGTAGDRRPDITTSESLIGLTGLAIDSAGTFVTAQQGGYDPAVNVFSSSGTLLRRIDHRPYGPFLLGSGPTAVTIDPANDHIFAADPTLSFQLMEFDTAGNVLNDQMGTTAVGATTGMAYNATATLPGHEAGVLYVADSQNSRLVLLVPVVAAPKIANTRVTDVRATMARLRATVNPNLRDTRYYFEYGTTSDYGATTAAPPGIDLGAEGTNHPVKAALASLQPATTYHYRAVAKNSVGTTYGPDRTLKTDRLATKFRLPDNRAYEQVSPIAKNSTEILNPEATVGPVSSQAAVDGSSIAYGVAGGYPGAEASVRAGMEMSFNVDGGWLTRGLEPLTGVSIINGTGVLAVSRDMSHSVVFSRLALTQGAIKESYNYYLRENRTGALKLMVSIPVNAYVESRFFVGGSTNFDRVYFMSFARLTPDAIDFTDNTTYNPMNLYEWAADENLRLASIDSDGTPVGSGYSGSTTGSTPVSSDGRRLYFDAGGVASLREDGRTVAISVSHRSADAGVAVAAEIFAVSADGSKAYFKSAQPLTDDAHGNRTELYEFNADTGGLRAISAGFDLAGPSDSQEVTGPIALTATGSTVYYSVTNASQSKIVVVRGGVSQVVASYDSAPSVVTPVGAPWPNSGSQTSPNGRFLTFTRLEDGPGSAAQIYRYDAETGGVLCASCRPTGEASEGGSRTSDNGALPPFEARSVTDTGQVFFQTSDPLVPEDTNSKQDVYEWSNGAPYLLSDGQSDSSSYYLDASESGEHVFIATHARLVGQDRDDIGDVYDVRVNGGIAGQNPGNPPAPCVGDACQGDGDEPPTEPAPASVTFAGSEGTVPTRAVKGQRKVKVSKPVVSRTGFTFEVTAPGKGKIRGTGVGVATVTKSVAKAGTYKVTARLTAKAKKALKSKKKLKVKVRVSFTPQAGAQSSTSVSVTLKA